MKNASVCEYWGCLLGELRTLDGRVVYICKYCGWVEERDRIGARGAKREKGEATA